MSMQTWTCRFSAWSWTASLAGQDRTFHADGGLAGVVEHHLHEASPDSADKGSASDDFEASFWSGGDLNTLYRSASRQEGGATGMASIFESGFREFNRLSQQGGDSRHGQTGGGVPARHAGIANARGRQAGAKPRDAGDDRLDQPVCRTVRHGLGHHERRSCRSVTTALRRWPSLHRRIAEALIATAVGLFAAIPAVIAYNRFADKVVRLEIRYDGFTEEFSSILQRHSRKLQKEA